MNYLMNKMLAISCMLLSMSAYAGIDEAFAAYAKKDYATALKELMPLASQGNATAQNNIGLMYKYGQGVPQDTKEAEKWFWLAYKQGNGNALSNLMQIYGGEKAVAEQEKLEADQKAEQGGSDAKYQRGLAYLGGSPWNLDAQKWFEKAAAVGSIDALYKLGVFQKDRFHDELEAERLWEQASQGGNVAAKAALSNLVSERNRKAEQRAREDAAMAAEAARQVNLQEQVAAFRKSIAEGDNTNCGLVIEVKHKLIKVSFAVANYGNEHWIRRDSIYPSGYGCRFFNGEYVEVEYQPLQ